MSRGTPFRSVLVLLLFGTWAVAPLSAQAAGGRGQVVARGPEVAGANGQKRLELRARELERTLLRRYGLSQEGRELLKLMVSTRLIEAIAVERSVVVGEKEIDRRWDEVEEGFKAAGEKGGLAGELARRNMSIEEFRDFLRVSLLHEELARQDLGLGRGSPVQAEQQTIWLDDQLQKRGLTILPAPWSGTPVARCGVVEIFPEEFGEFLRQQLRRDDIEETAWHLLLTRGLARRMPQLSDEAFQAGITKEIERRRAKHAREQPKFTFAQYLSAQGRTLDGLREDPAVHIATLSRMYVDQRYGPEGLRSTFDEERELFEGRYGEALRAHMIFLVASRFRNELNPRTFEDAEKTIGEYAQRIGNLSDFAELAKTVSEEPKSRERMGDIGWVTRAAKGYPRALCDALFQDWGKNKTIPAGGRALPLVRLESGVALLWVSDYRESPSWEAMAELVHEELRRRLLTDVLPRDKVQMGSGS